MTPEDFKIKVLPLKHKLFRLALRMLGSVDEAEDVVQDSLVKLWIKRQELDNYSSIEAFAMTITKNHSLDRIRSKSFQAARISDRAIVNLAGEKEEKLETEDYTGFVHRIIDSLPEQQKVIMQMRDIEGFDYDKIAEVMALNVNAVRVNLSRARKKVRDTILKIQGYELTRN